MRFTIGRIRIAAAVISAVTGFIIEVVRHVTEVGA